MYETINFFSPFDESDSRPFSLEMTGISYCDGSYRIRRKKPYVCVIEYIVSGRGTVISNGISYTAEAGDVYILNKSYPHEYFSSSDDPWVKKFFNIKGDLCTELLQIYSLNDTVVFKNCDVKEYFDDMYTLSCNEGGLDADTLLEELSIKLHRLILEISKRVNKARSVNEMSTVKQFIDNNFSRIVSNDELSALTFRSNDYIIKGFKAAYGVTPYDYQINKKISLAKSLLVSTVLPINDIAARLGYSDQHYFSNLFTRKSGMSPLKYRKNHKEKSKNDPQNIKK